MTINFIACGLKTFKWLNFEQKNSHLCVSEHLKQESTSKNEIYTMISMGEQNLNDVAKFF